MQAAPLPLPKGSLFAFLHLPALELLGAGAGLRTELPLWPLRAGLPSPGRAQRLQPGRVRLPLNPAVPPEAAVSPPGKEHLNLGLQVWVFLLSERERLHAQTRQVQCLRSDRGGRPASLFPGGLNNLPASEWLWGRREQRG